MWIHNETRLLVLNVWLLYFSEIRINVITTANEELYERIYAKQ